MTAGGARRGRAGRRGRGGRARVGGRVCWVEADAQAETESTTCQSEVTSGFLRFIIIFSFLRACS